MKTIGACQSKHATFQTRGFFEISIIAPWTGDHNSAECFWRQYWWSENRVLQSSRAMAGSSAPLPEWKTSKGANPSLSRPQHIITHRAPKPNTGEVEWVLGTLTTEEQEEVCQKTHDCGRGNHWSWFWKLRLHMSKYMGDTYLFQSLSMICTS